GAFVWNSPEDKEMFAALAQYIVSGKEQERIQLLNRMRPKGSFYGLGIEKATEPPKEPTGSAASQSSPPLGSEPSVKILYREAPLHGRTISLSTEPRDSPTSRVQHYVQKDSNIPSMLDLYGLSIVADGSV